MKVAIPSEVKNHECRVAITLAGVKELVAHGHEVYVETDACALGPLDSARVGVATGHRLWFT